MQTTLIRIAALALALSPAVASAQTSGGNPPGTAAGRALDRAAGTNNSGAYPSQADGTPGTPPGTAASRATDPATQSAHRAARKPQTLRNNSASRAVDRTAGTNNSGAYPAQSDGMPGNPPGTAAGRALGTTNSR